MATNPAASMPDADRVAAALAKCPFVVVSDCVADTDTLRHAHVKLPALAWGEKDGTVTNSERRISRQRAFLPVPGEALADWKIVAGVAQRLGAGGAFAWRNAADIFAEHAALSAFENDGTRDFDLSGLEGTDFDSLRPTQWPVHAGGSNARMFADGGFFTADRRAPLPARGPSHARECTGGRVPVRPEHGPRARPLAHDDAHRKIPAPRPPCERTHRRAVACRRGPACIWPMAISRGWKVRGEWPCCAYGSMRARPTARFSRRCTGPPPIRARAASTTRWSIRRPIRCRASRNSNIRPRAFPTGFRRGRVSCSPAPRWTCPVSIIGSRVPVTAISATRSRTARHSIAAFSTGSSVPARTGFLIPTSPAGADASHASPMASSPHACSSARATRCPTVHGLASFSPEPTCRPICAARSWRAGRPLSSISGPSSAPATACVASRSTMRSAAAAPHPTRSVAATRAGTNCGSCVPELAAALAACVRSAA